MSIQAPLRSTSNEYHRQLAGYQAWFCDPVNFSGSSDLFKKCTYLAAFFHIIYNISLPFGLQSNQTVIPGVIEGLGVV